MTISLKDVQIQLVDVNASLIKAWRRAFMGCDRVIAEQGSLLDVQVDAIVSPANSFGFMDGGFDLLLSEHFGWQMEQNVRERLLAEFDGELPVGEAIIVESGHEQVQWLISAPTMRVPMNVSQTANAYLAMRGILRAVREHNTRYPENPIASLACPGLGTGEGRMPPERCAKQMRHAFNVCVLGQHLTRGGLAAAARNHMDLIDYPCD